MRAAISHADARAARVEVPALGAPIEKRYPRGMRICYVCRPRMSAPFGVAPNRLMRDAQHGNSRRSPMRTPRKPAKSHLSARFRP